ncbi:MAG: ABC transporter permease [Ferruginibacter sp.]
MFRNYFKIAWRSLWKHKLFSFINIFGLALSLAVCMLVMIQLKDDLSYDLFHPHPSRTYRVLSDIVENKNNKQYELASTPLPLKAELAQHTNEVEDAVQLYPAIKEKATFEGKELYIRGAFTDPSFFKVFGFQLSSGDEKDALAATNGIVLSKETALKFFGNTNPIGKVLNFETLGLFQVTGVLKDPPGKSHIAFDVYASSLALQQLENTKALPESVHNWNTMNDSYTYVLVKENISKSSLNKLLHQVAQKPELKSGEGEIDFTAQPLSSITPGTDGIYNEIGRGTVWAKVLTVAGIGLIILLAACFNYTNLTIARALTRAKEVGIRKVAGASRLQVFTQYIVESVLIALLAFSLACIGLLQFKAGLQFDPSLFAMAVLFTLITGICAGAFPAWMLSSFKPVQVLKSVSTQKLFGNVSLQKGLLIFQFSLSLLIIIFLSAYYQQFSYVQALDPGFASKNILTIPISGNDKIFANEVSHISGVENIARISDDFGMRGTGSMQVFKDKPGNQQGVQCDFYFADAVTIPVHKLKIMLGSNFPGNEAGTREQYILINQKAASILGFKNAASAVGKTVWLNDSTNVEIKGVLRDFYDKGAARYINPLVLRNKAGAFNYMNILVSAGAENKIVQKVSSVWKKINPRTPFEYEWLDKKIANREDQSDTYAIMGFLAFITITIATLGLLGLVVYTVETKQKEISIRKIIGASVKQLMFLLSKGFFKLLLVSGLIAMPTGYILSFMFLQNFSNRVPFGIGSLLLCFIFLLLIGLATILSNTYKAATANPVENLRTE